MPRRWATAAASTRPPTPSLARMLETCTLAVLALMNSSLAICGLERPAATSARTSRSRSVRPKRASSSGGRGGAACSRGAPAAARPVPAGPVRRRARRQWQCQPGTAGECTGLGGDRLGAQQAGERVAVPDGAAGRVQVARRGERLGEPKLAVAQRVGVIRAFPRGRGRQPVRRGVQAALDRSAATSSRYAAHDGDGNLQAGRDPRQRGAPGGELAGYRLPAVTVPGGVIRLQRACPARAAARRTARPTPSRPRAARPSPPAWPPRCHHGRARSSPRWTAASA